jgi:hypothetical protein
MDRQHFGYQQLCGGQGATFGGKHQPAQTLKQITCLVRNPDGCGKLIIIQRRAGQLLEYMSYLCQLPPDERHLVDWGFEAAGHTHAWLTGERCPAVRHFPPDDRMPHCFKALRYGREVIACSPDTADQEIRNREMRFSNERTKHGTDRAERFIHTK